MSRPFVSVITPTYNRRQFFEASLQCFVQQSYPRSSMEWIIIDDGTEKIGDLVELAKTRYKDLNIRYIDLPEKITLGKKRNMLNQEAKGEIIVCWDDDDYYPPERVAHAVFKLQSQPKAELAGSSQMYIYFQDDKTIWQNGPYGPNHTTNGPLAYKKSYIQNHSYEEHKDKAEEKHFLADYKLPIIQMDPRKAILVVAHGRNTVTKDMIREQGKTISKKTTFKLKDFIRDSAVRALYA
jgi:glycosyltransferase involved in cell wall biosynthesis